MPGKQSKWNRSPDDPVYGGKLLLPSFGIYVTRSDPYVIALPKGSGTDDMVRLDSGDAFSVSYLYAQSHVSTADQDFLRLDPGYLKRILLRVLDGEEYQEIVDHHHALIRWDVRTGFPEGQKPTIMDYEFVRDPNPTAQVRVTDLRLAKDLTTLVLKRELKPLLRRLELPVTTAGVTRWKYETLKEHKAPLKELHELTEEERSEETKRVMAVSFAAAALLLLHDLDMRRLEEAGHDDLAKHVGFLAGLTKSAIEDLDKFADQLLGLLANQGGGGRPPDPGVKHYTALALYRMGRPLKEVAVRIGTQTPLPKNWRNKTCEAIRHGVKVEKEKFPRAAAVLARKDDEKIKAKAIEIYHEYLDAAPWEEAAHYLEVDKGDDLLGGVPANEKAEVYRAYVQLGSCLENGIEPLP